jgi:hypothetical protein
MAASHRVECEPPDSDPASSVPCISVGPGDSRILPQSSRPLDSAVFFTPDCSTPPLPTLFFCSTRNAHGYCDPILVTVTLRPYLMLQLTVFDGCPFTLACTRSVGTGIQGNLPSVRTLFSRSTRYHQGNCGPIFVTLLLYRIFQLAVLVFYPFTRTPSRQGDAGIQGIVPSAVTLICGSTRPNLCHRAFVAHPSACCLRLLFIYLFVHSLGRRC